MWKAGLVMAGAAGHINGDSGLGAWPFGAALLEAFVAGCAQRAEALPARDEMS